MIPTKSLKQIGIKWNFETSGKGRSLEVEGWCNGCNIQVDLLNQLFVFFL